MSSSISRVQNINHQDNSSLQDHDSKTGVINTVTDFGIQQIKQQLRYEITNDLLEKLNYNVDGESTAINADDSSSKKNDSDIATISAINYEIVCLLEIIINNSNSSTLSSICSNIKKRLILQFPNADISSRLSNVNTAPRRKRKRTAAMQMRRFNDNNNEVLLHGVSDTHQYNRKNDEEDEDVLAYSSTNKLRRIDELVNNGDSDRNITAAMNKTNNNSNSYQELSFASDQFILNINGLNHNLSNLEKLLTESHNNNNGHDQSNDQNHKIQHRNENSINIANHNNQSSINNSLRVENLISKDSPYFPSNDSSDNNNAIIASSSNTAVYGSNEVNSSTICATSNNNSNNIDKISIHNILNGQSSLPSLPAYNIDSNRQHTQQKIDKSQLQQNAKQSNASGKSNNNTLSAAMIIPSIASLIDSIPSISSQNHANGNFGPTNVVFPLTSSMPVSSEITSNSISLQTCLIPKFPNDLFTATWYGNDLTYSNENQPIRFKSLKFELINMAFNIGAAYSQISMSKNDTDENIKKNCNNFQMSAGCFEYTSRLLMKYNDLIPHLPSDIDIECINFVKWIMLAQAQELIWVKANRNLMKDSILARLSKQASIYYENAMNIADKLNIFKTTYYNYVHVKKFHFEAVAQYRYALACSSEQKHGDEVSRLRQSLELSNKSLKFLKLCDPGLSKDIYEFNSVLKSTLDSSEKENDLIYLTLVPPFETLELIQPAPMVKPIILEELETPNKFTKPLFQDLLPFYVIQTSQAFRERQELYVKESFNDIIYKLNLGLDNFLSSRNLPACIDSLEDNSSLPHSFVLKLEEIKNLGGIQRIESTIHDIDNLKNQSYKYVDGCKHRLELEFNEDNLLRERYGTIYWTRQPSSLVGKPLIDEIQKLDNYLISAKHGDLVIENSYLKIKDSLKLLSRSTAEDLSKMIQQNNKVNSDLRDLNLDENRELHTKISELKDLILESENLKEERKDFLSIIDIKSTRMTILPKIIEEYKVLSKQNKVIDSSCQPFFEKIYEEHISGFKSDLGVVQNEKVKQESLESRIETAFNEFIKLKNITQIKSGNLKEEFLTNLQNNYDDFIKLVNNLDQAVTFYNSFLVKCNSTITMIDKYIDERRLEARDLETETNNSISKDNNSNKHPKTWNPGNGINFE